MDEPTLESQTHALGEAMRGYRGFQLPGIDMLGYNFEYTTAKQAQSAVHQYGRCGMVSELYGGSGWQVDFRDYKLLGDWQAALGVTVRVPHLSWVSMKGEAKRDWPGDINYQCPWWKDVAYLENHYARISTALTRGKPVVKVGVIHPIESFWLHWGPRDQTGDIRKQLDRRFIQLTDWLVNGGVDFDFISESLLPDLCKVGEAPLRVGEMAYEVIVVPGCETLRSTTLERLEAYQKNGGQLIFLGKAPQLENAVCSARPVKLFENSISVEYDQQALLGALDPVRLIDMRLTSGVRTENLAHQLRRDGDRMWLFIANSCLNENKDASIVRHVIISVKGQWTVKLYDTITGDIKDIPFATGDRTTEVYAGIYDDDSLLLCLDPGKGSYQEPAKKEYKRQVTLPILASYSLDEPNVCLLDKAEYALDGGEWYPETEILRADDALRDMVGLPSRKLAVAQPWAVDREKIKHTVSFRFAIHAVQRVTGTKLALEDAEDAHITLNGKALPIKVDGWYVDRCIKTIPLGELHQGENILEVKVPFGTHTNLEWCYLLGRFGVRVIGEYKEIIPMADQLGFEDWAAQGMPFYGGNVTYHLPFASSGAKMQLRVPHYRGTAIRCRVDEEKEEYLVLPPYTLDLKEIAAGTHTLHLTVLGNRNNSFGPVHLAYRPQGRLCDPGAWHSDGNE